VGDDGDETALEWACENCPKKRSSDPNPSTHKLLRLRSLQAGGYVIDNDELSAEEWMDLGWIKQALEPPKNCPLMHG